MSTDRINRRAKIEMMPRIRFVCGADYSYSPKTYQVGAYWSRNLNATEGEICYRRWLVWRITVRAWLNTRVRS